MSPSNLLLIGNSHTAAPRIALRDRPDRWPDFRPDVFAMPGDTLAELELRDRVLLPQNDEVRRKMDYYNGISELPLSGYDGFVVIGGLGFHAQVWTAAVHCAGDFPSVRNGAAEATVSSGLIDAAMAHRIAGSSALRLVRALAGLGQGPVLFLDQVLPSADCRADPQNFGPLVKVAARGDGAALHERYLHLLRQALADDALHVAQPARTIVDAVFTAPEWMRGSIRMQPRRDVPHEATEYGHANAAYGALQIDQIVAALGL